MLGVVGKRASVIAALVMLSANASAQPAPAAVHITGVVIEAHTDTPIRRARIEVGATSTRYSPVFTDERGRFSLDVPPGTLLAITKAGFAPESVRVQPARTSESSDIQIAMNRAAAITGRVIDASGTPLVNMTVVLRDAPAGLPARSRTTHTNDLGEFRFGALAAGEFALQSPVATSSVRVAPGENVDLGDVSDAPATSAVSGGVSYTRRRPAITGTISDEYGDPVEGAFIRVLQIRRVDARLAALPAEGVSRGISDDRGAYRVFGLQAGRYLIVADVVGYAPTYYSSVTAITGAFPIVINQSDVEGIDFAFRRERTVRVVGTAIDSAGQPVAGAVLLGVSQRSGAVTLEPRVASTAGDGTFAFENVPAGDYVLQVSAPVGGLRPKVEDNKLLTPRTEFGMQRLSISGDDEPAPVLLRTSVGATLRGRVTVDGQPSTPPGALTVWPFPTDFDMSSMIGGGAAGLTKNKDGSFIVTGVTGPRRFIVMVPADGWFLKDARVGGTDAMDAPFDFGMAAHDFNDVEIVVSPAAATVAGTATTSRGEAAANYLVLLFSADSSKWYRSSQTLRLERPSQNGGFRIGGLPPGSYYVLAIGAGSDLVTSGDWGDPATLERLRSMATEVTISEGETRSVTLRISPQP